ncbi:hypothetical protein [Bacillus sp. T3]|uniref:hypothetical protein n=1 Tax=Bacillus sp. T3 TaxID=467262 RepID=UPI00298196B1|nr:hypothetical protein [Bacillus sp. T3]
MSSENQTVKPFIYKNRGFKTGFKDSELLNLPDLHFFLYCQRNYKINKGVFNTIDNWFFEYGIIQVLNRRIHILAFLDFVLNETSRLADDSNRRKFLRFGVGGLSKKLSEFISDTESGGFII